MKMQNFLSYLPALLSLKAFSTNPHFFFPVDLRLNLIGAGTIFDARQVPSITIEAYVMRMKELVVCSESCYIIALLYLDLIVQKHKSFRITRYNIHRLYLTSMVVTVKFYEDEYYDNIYWSYVGGIACEEMNVLEKEMLLLLDFNLTISKDNYDHYLETMRAYYHKVLIDIYSKDAETKSDDTEDSL